MNINGVQQAGMYGLLGVILSCLGVLPYIGLLCAIAALVLIVLANKQLATETGDEAIFKGTLIFVVLTFVAVLVGLLLGGAAALVMAKKQPGAGIGFGAILSFIVAYILIVYAYYQAKKVYFSLAEHFDVPQFRTAGNLLFWGAVATIVFIGGIIILVGWIFAAIGYNELRKYEPANISS